MLLENSEKMRRKFTIMADAATNLLSLSIMDLNRIRLEFKDEYKKLMDDGGRQLQKALILKMKANCECLD